MANAKQCDRCGVFYSENVRFPEMLCKRKTVIKGMFFTGTQGLITDHVDLCDDCISKLRLFLSGVELKEG